MARGGRTDRRPRLLVDAPEQRRRLRRLAAARVSGTLRIEAGALQEDAGKDEIVAVEYVDPFAERLLHEAARRMIGQPALEMQPALERREARPLVGPLRHVAAQCLFVREGKMREVEKVVVDQQIMRAVVELARLQSITRIVERQRRR